MTTHPCPKQEGCPTCEGQNIWDWSFVDTIFCICLDTRDDRMRHSAKQFHKFGLCNRVIYYRAVRPEKKLMQELKIETPGTYGCWESHRIIMELAIEKKSNRNLIFEDDVTFLDILTPQHLLNIKNQVENLPPDWEMFFLGHLPAFSNWPTEHHGVWRVHSVFTHAYIQSRAFMSKFKNISYTDVNKIGSRSVQLDAYFMKTTIQYATVPMIAVQSNMLTDISSIPLFLNFFNQNPKFFDMIWLRGLFWFILIALCVVIICLVFSKRFVSPADFREY